MNFRFMFNIADGGFTGKSEVLASPAKLLQGL